MLTGVEVVGDTLKYTWAGEETEFNQYGEQLQCGCSAHIVHLVKDTDGNNLVQNFDIRVGKS